MSGLSQPQPHVLMNGFYYPSFIQYIAVGGLHAGGVFIVGGLLQVLDKRLPALPTFHTGKSTGRMSPLDPDRNLHLADDIDEPLLLEDESDNAGPVTAIDPWLRQASARTTREKRRQLDLKQTAQCPTPLSAKLRRLSALPYQDTSVFVPINFPNGYTSLSPMCCSFLNHQAPKAKDVVVSLRSFARVQISRCASGLSSSNWKPFCVTYTYSYIVF
jgi:hypothetical protein